MPKGKDKTPGFSMSACITKMSKNKNIDEPGALCQSMYQKVSKGEMKNAFPEKPLRHAKK